MIFFNIFLVVLISHRALSAAVIAQAINLFIPNFTERAVTTQDIPTRNIAQQIFQCQYPQQVFNIYNSYCDGQKPTPKMPDGYTLTPGVGAHKLHLEKKNWNDARNICIKEGAHLSVIESAAEENIFAKLTTDNKVHDVWLGVHELFKDGDWLTVQDTPLDNVGYKHWKQGEPNQAFENVEHCGSYIQNEGMNDLNCNKELPFVCEIHLV